MLSTAEAETHLLFKIMFKINTFIYYKPSIKGLISEKNNNNNINQKNLNNNNNIEFSDSKIINEQILDFFKCEYNKYTENTANNCSTASPNKRKITKELFKYKSSTYKVLRRKREFWMFIES